MTVCFCSHRAISHELNGVCTMRKCPCIKYQQILGSGIPVAADFDLRRPSKLRQDSLGDFS